MIFNNSQSVKFNISFWTPQSREEWANKLWKKRQVAGYTLYKKASIRSPLLALFFLSLFTRKRGRTTFVIIINAALFHLFFFLSLLFFIELDILFNTSRFISQPTNQKKSKIRIAYYQFSKDFVHNSNGSPVRCFGPGFVVEIGVLICRGVDWDWNHGEEEVSDWSGALHAVWGDRARRQRLCSSRSLYSDEWGCRRQNPWLRTR